MHDAPGCTESTGATVSTRGWIILALIVIAVVLVLWGLRHSPPSAMRTADQKQIDRDTAAIQRQVPDPKRIAGCDVEQFCTSRSVSRDWARRNARHAARKEDLFGTVPVNPYDCTSAEYMEWSIELAKARAEIHAQNTQPLTNQRTS